ncbi:uncharacterized protein PEZ65_022501 [Lycodopsis pacificus]
MSTTGARDFFSWTDDEVQLLLHVTREYKVENAAQNMDWESIHSKYGDILARFRDNYPTPSDATHVGKDFPHNKDELTKVQLTTKVKAIRVRYRQVVDFGKRSGHGRVVLLYFELCQCIWGGSPATTAIRHGIETGMEVEALGANGSTSVHGSPSVPSNDRASGSVTSAETVASRRQSLDASLGGHRREKLKRKLSMESVAQEDLEIKRQLVHRVDTTDAAFLQLMERWSSSMERSSSSMERSMDRLNSNIEVMMRHIVGSRPMTPHALHQAPTTHTQQPHFHSPVHRRHNSTQEMHRDYTQL